LASIIVGGLQLRRMTISAANAGRDVELGRLPPRQHNDHQAPVGILYVIMLDVLY
jgi:hypothetical protein